jgi:molybdopterin synthase sulfur carrier subunit
MYDTSPMDEATPAIGDHVAVHLFAAARSAAATDVLVVPAGTLAQVLASCERQAAGLADVLPRCSYLVNGIAVSDEDARLLPGDRLDVLPPFAGG